MFKISNVISCEIKKTEIIFKNITNLNHLDKHLDLNDGKKKVRTCNNYLLKEKCRGNLDCNLLPLSRAHIISSVILPKG